MDPELIVTDVNHPDQPSSIFRVVGDAGTRFALVRDECIITLLTAAHVERNLRGTWVRSSTTSSSDAPEPVVAAATTLPVAVAVVDDREEIAIPHIPIGLARAGVDVMEAQLEVSRAAAREAAAADALGRARAELDAAQTTLDAALARVRSEADRTIGS